MKVRDLIENYDYSYDGARISFELYYYSTLGERDEYEFVDSSYDPTDFKKVYDCHVYHYGVDVNRKILYIVYDNKYPLGNT